MKITQMLKSNTESKQYSKLTVKKAVPKNGSMNYEIKSYLYS